MMDSIEILSRLNQFKNDLANEGNYDMCIRVKELIREINPMKISDLPTKVKCWDDDELIWPQNEKPFIYMDVADSHDRMVVLIGQIVKACESALHEQNYYLDKIKNGSI